MATPPSHSQAVLPNPHILVLDSVQRDERGFLLEVSTRHPAHCPDCGRKSRSFHSSYQRQLQDLPWQGLSVRLRLRARRFRCRNPPCSRKIFVERLPNVAESYARQTTRLKEIIRSVGFVTGGLPGSRLLARLAIHTSDDTVLRLVKLLPLEESQEDAVRCLGVDDWAWRKGQNYGTILVDLERRSVADLLPERSVESLAEWLIKHPAVTTISRDRAGLYAQGAERGAPDAQQIADRFHLLLNLSAALERALEERSRQLQAPALDVQQEREPDVEAADSGPELTQQQKVQGQRRQRRFDLYQEVLRLHAEGHSQRAISQALGMQRKTVRCWLRADQFPERKRVVRKPAQVQAFAEYLQQRWTEGCHNATQLFQEIRNLGYRGQRSMVAKLVSAWRAPRASPTPTRQQRIAPRQAAVLTSREPGQLTESQRTLFDQLCLTCPDLKWMRTLVLEFRTALTSKDRNQLCRWIQMAKHSGIGPLIRFAFSLKRDISAVSAAVESSWSNGQVEGQINRLKMLKRQMYGRAGIRLMRARVRPYRALSDCCLQRAP
jgi:transposase